MATERVEFVAGNFAPPNIDNNNKTTANVDIDGFRSAGRSVMSSFIVQQLKSSATQGISRIGASTGNRSRQENLQSKIEILGDLGTIGTGFASGGLIGGAVGIATVGIQKAFKGYDLTIQERNSNWDSTENARRFGILNNNTKRGFR